MCEEFQLAAGPVEIYVACGRDAAERILDWDYADPQALEVARVSGDERGIQAPRGRRDQCVRKASGSGRGANVTQSRC